MKSYFLLTTCLALLVGLTSHAEEALLAGKLKASLRFREAPATDKGYPHLLQVYLCLENTSDSVASWNVNLTHGFEVFVLDEAGVAAPTPPANGSFLSETGVRNFCLPVGSKMEWLISTSGGVSMMGDLENNYAVIFHPQNSWLIPRAHADSYQMRVRLLGTEGRPGRPELEEKRRHLLLSLPLTKIVVEK